MENVIENVLNLAIKFIPKLGIALLIFLLFWILGKIVQKIIVRISKRFEGGKHRVLLLAGGVSKLAILILGGITALGTMGINVTALVAGLGLGGFALGFALKDTLANLLAGALILIYEPFRYGDHIVITGYEGKVIEINLRYTILQGDDKKYFIPNSILYTNAIVVSKKD